MAAPLPTWLMKSEPDCYSFADLQRDALAGKDVRWTDVRNYTARNYMNSMQVGEQFLFYHSNIGKEIVGVGRISGLAAPDETVGDGELTKDGRNPWVAVAVEPCFELKRPVPLTVLRAHPLLGGMMMFTHNRLSITPVTADEWAAVLALGGA